MFSFPVAHWSAPAATGISFGRNATGSITGTNTNYTVGFSGGASAAGTWVVAVIQDVDTGQATISGGSAWTKAAGGQDVGSGYSARCYYKKCGASEPSTYTVTYAGSSKSDANCVTIFEVLGANATNPDDIQVTSNTATPHSVTSSATTDCVVLVAADSQMTGAGFTPPTGYTAQGNIEVANGTTFLLTAIAAKLNVGAGTISPGAWGSPETSADFLWTIAFKL